MKAEAGADPLRLTLLKLLKAREKKGKGQMCEAAHGLIIDTMLQKQRRLGL